MHPVRSWTLLCLLAALLAACAISPEAKLKRGYDTVTGATKTTAVLLRRGAISVDDARAIETMATTAVATLDRGRERLKACRAAAKADCTDAVSTIELGSGVLLELERYLAAAATQETKP